MSPAPDRPDGIRLQRVLASAGLGSRRACEELIEEGRVEVDGKVVVEQGMRVDPARAVIKVDGLRIATAPDHVYIALNKPRGVVSTMSDPEGRPSLQEYVGDRAARLFHVGRLDTDTEGLILLTNDGDLAHRLAHPRYGVEKEYVVDVEGAPTDGTLRKLAEGVELEDGPTAPAGVERLGRSKIELTLHEGRNRQVRRMCEAVGHPVVRLHRSRYAGLGVGKLAPGHWRELSAGEVSVLRSPSTRTSS
jgi:23S rRNA pseudouridine2605 synthase